MDEQQQKHKEEILSYVPNNFSLTTQKIMEALLIKE